MYRAVDPVSGVRFAVKRLSDGVTAAATAVAATTAVAAAATTAAATAAADGFRGNHHGIATAVTAATTMATTRTNGSYAVGAPMQPWQRQRRAAERAARREIAVLRSVRHPNIIKLLGWVLLGEGSAPPPSVLPGDHHRAR